MRRLGILLAAWAGVAFAATADLRLVQAMKSKDAQAVQIGRAHV